MDKKTIVFDLDGVLANFHYSFSIILNKLYRTPIITNINDVKQWDWCNWYPISIEQHEEAWEYVKTIKNFWTTLDPLVNTDTFKKIYDLQKEGHSIYFITTRNKSYGLSISEQTANWFKKWCLSVHVIVAKNKGLILKEINADFFIDDSPLNILNAIEKSPNTKSYLIKRRYNFLEQQTYLKNQKFVESVNQFIDIINSEINE